MYLSIVIIMSEVTAFGYLSSIQLLQDDELNQMFNALLILMFFLLLISFPIVYVITDLAVFIAITVGLNFYYSFAEKTFIRNMETKRLNVIRIGRVSLNALVIIGSFYVFGGNDLQILIKLNILSIAAIDGFIYFMYLKPYKFFNLNLKHLHILKVQKDFPKYIGPGMLCNTLAYQIPILVAGSFFSSTVAAQYNMAYKLVYTPGILISGSISNVYQGRLSKLFRQNKSVFQGFTKFLLILCSMAIIFVSLIGIVLKVFVENFFEEQWMKSIDMSLGLLPLIFSLMAISPLLGILKFTNNLKYSFMLQLISLLFSGIAFVLAIHTKNFVLGITTFSILMLIAHLTILVKLFSIRKEALYA